MNQLKAQYQPSFNPVVFIGAALVILGITLYAFFQPEAAGALFNNIQTHIIDVGGWFYILSVAIILVTIVYLGFSRFGDIKLGPDHATPDYSRTTWFAMLFSAGMGIGLMFYGVAEPVMHMLTPPTAEPGTLAAAREAMNVTFFHWGLHAWAIYAIVALILAVFAYRHGLPLSLRSALYPLIGERIYGRIGDLVDIFAIIGTLFGVATSLGLGVSQVNAGLHHLIPAIPINETTQAILIIVITLFATVSVVSGLDKGIKILSEINLGMAGLLMLFVLFAGPTVYLFQALTQNLGDYLSGIVQKTFNLYAYSKTDWSIGGWTLFYWGWWIAWSPFVGMFIARVSRGRTIREFLTGVLLIPTGFTLVWMTVFGNSAIEMITVQGNQALADMVSNDVSIALFSFLESLPLASITTVLAMIMVVVFFVTSSDSGSLVIDILACNGSDDNPVWMRIFWAFSEGIVAIVLLQTAGGLGALQTMTIASALPFTIVLLFSMYGLIKVLKVDLHKQDALQFDNHMPQTVSAKGWQSRLQNIIDFPSKEKVSRFIANTALPALQSVCSEIRHNTQLEANVAQISDECIRLHVIHGEAHDFIYEVRVAEHTAPALDDELIDHSYARAEVHLNEGGQDYDVMGWSEDGIINDILNQYHKHMYFLHRLA